VYCGLGHPLFLDPTAVADSVLRHRFVGCFPRMSSWPAKVPRRIGLYVDHEDTALELCLGGEYLAELPDAVAHPHVPRGRLRRVRASAVSASPLHPDWRTGDESQDR